jgi:uncharacterized Zn finger protein (UPF0148 family)
MNIYCQKCGQPNHYGSKKPIFCGYCGESLDGRPKESVASKKQTLKERIAKAQNEDEEEEITLVPDIQKIDVEIESPKLKGFKIGDIAGSTPENAAVDEAGIAPKEGPPLDEEKFMSDFQKEAGSLRQKGKGNA